MSSKEKYVILKTDFFISRIITYSAVSALEKYSKNSGEKEPGNFTTSPGSLE